MIKIYKDKMSFVKVTDGNEDLINEKPFNFLIVDEAHLGLQRIEVNYAVNKIDVRMMIDPSIVFTEMMKEDNFDIHRGKIGLAKKGDVKVKISLIETKPATFAAEAGEWDPMLILGQQQFAEPQVIGQCSNQYKMLPDDENSGKSMKIASCNTAMGFCSLRGMDFGDVSA